MVTEMVSQKAKDDYESVLIRARTHHSPEAVTNLYPWHAERAVVQLMKHANDNSQATSARTVRLISGSCPNFVYGGEAYDEFEKFAENGGTVKILVWGRSNSEERSRLTRLQEEFPQNVELRKSDSDELVGEIPHFLLVDNDAYRFEVPHPPHTAATGFEALDPPVPARICFNDSDYGARLLSLFNGLWTRLEVPIP